MRITLLGTGSPMPDARRAGPSTLVQADGLTVLVDCGRGVMMRLVAAGVLPPMLDAMLITHLHSDHITDLGDVITTRWIMSFGPTAPLVVVGPVGTRDVVDRIAASIDGPAAPTFGALADRPLEQVRVADVAATRAVLGWAPSITLDDGLAKLDDGRRTLTNTRALAALGAAAATLAVSQAEDARGRTVVKSPAAGVVVSAARVGDTLAPGASLVVLRPVRPASVTTWLSPAETARACVGAATQVRADWGATYPGRVTRLGVQADYPPTSLATDEVHLTRAVAVTITLDAGGSPPPGVGVDVRITPCQTQSGA